MEIEQEIGLIETPIERGDVTAESRKVRHIADGDVTLCLVHGALILAVRPWPRTG